MAEAKSKFASLIGQTAYGGKRFILERRGQPMAVLIGVDEYQRLRGLEQEAQRLPMSPELRQRQQELVAKSRRLQALLGDPVGGLVELMSRLPPRDDEFWLQVVEGGV
ncbi:MAG: type II toxin-antitoxin system Phd/YefM family antitoxin [Chloroflexota bacterium]